MSVLSLADSQKKFWSALNKVDDDIFSFVCADDSLAAEDRVEVYRTTARSQHVSVLASIYPVCKKILGDDYFKLIAKKYFLNYSSVNPDLNYYGKDFPLFLSELVDQRIELREYSYLEDLARLEWCMHASCYSRDREKLDLRQFEEQCGKFGGEIKFKLVDDVELIESEFPIAAIWNQHQYDNDLFEIEAISQCEFICVYRENYEVTFDLVNESVYKLMFAIRQNSSLFELADLFGSSDELNIALEYIMTKQWLRL